MVATILPSEHVQQHGDLQSKDYKHVYIAAECHPSSNGNVAARCKAALKQIITVGDEVIMV